MDIKEINELPEYWEKLTPKDRLNFIAKLAPYILPKVESVKADSDKSPFGFSWGN
ncbi:MAG: hypothetical protein AAF696_35725 [Bacteroidota bacterium]